MFSRSAKYGSLYLTKNTAYDIHTHSRTHTHAHTHTRTHMRTHLEDDTILTCKKNTRCITANLAQIYRLHEAFKYYIFLFRTYQHFETERQLLKMSMSPQMNKSAMNICYHSQSSSRLSYNYRTTITNCVP